jgi:YbgC/YbaW family acyl-CoA thioester hydrolase
LSWAGGIGTRSNCEATLTNRTRFVKPALGASEAFSVSLARHFPFANGAPNGHSAAMPYEFKARRQVEFSDTDMAGIVHYSNFFRFMETAEHGFYRSLGFSVTMPGTDPRLGWPRVHASCDFRRPLRFEDVVEIHLLVAEKKSKSLTFQFRFRKLNAPPVEEVARGALTIVCVAHLPDGTMKSVPVPPEIADRIEVAPLELLA